VHAEANTVGALARCPKGVLSFTVSMSILLSDTSHLVFCIPFFLVLQFSCELERRLNMNGGSKLLEFQAISYAIGTPDIKKDRERTERINGNFFYH
jgi:hypothetical protein